MKSLFAILVLGLASVSMAVVNPVNPNFILDVTDPAHVMFGAKTGGSPVTIDLFQITSASGSLNIAPLYVDMFLAGWNTTMVSTPAEYQVSYRLPSAGQQLGVTWAGGTLYDLGALIPAGWTFAQAKADLAINGYDNAAGGAGAFQGVVVPEPASMSMLALGALALIRRRR